MTRYLTFFACLLFTFAAQAQNAGDTLRYVPSDIGNVSDQLFKKGILKTDDPAAIEEYIRIHHCGVYEQYQRDDFSWSRVREGQARDLDVRLSSLPDGLEVTNMISVTQYDMTNGQFGIAPASMLANVGMLTVFNDPSGFINVCDHPFVPRVHPLNVVVKLDNPVTLDGIPMSHATADALLDEMNSRVHVKAKDTRNVMMIFRIRITGVDPLSVVTDPMHRVVQGQLDDIRIYEGPNRKLLIFKKSFENPQAKDGKN